MADFLVHLPRPSFTKPSAKSENDIGSFSLVPVMEPSKPKVRSTAPPYGHREGWVPRAQSDFGNGGAFPEVHVAQFPLDMGKKASISGKTVPLQTGPDGKLQYDAILKQNRFGGATDKMVVYTRPDAQVAKNSTVEDLQRPDADEEAATVAKTRQAIETLVEQKANAGVVVRTREREPTYIKYTPNQQAPGHNANCAQRIIRLVEKQVDPMEPSKFKNKRVPRGPPSPPPPIQHSPPRKLTKEDQLDWKIPPCVSNWKNRNGYTIPLDKRLQADGRGLQEITINDKHAVLAESLNTSERLARNRLQLRNEMVLEQKKQQEHIRNQQLSEIAAKSRADRSQNQQTLRQPEQMGSGLEKTDIDALKHRQEIGDQRKRELERDFRLEKAGKKSKRSRDEDRDVSERVALSQAQPTTSKESLYDARLFNQTAGLDSGYNAGEDEKYNVYDRPLFPSRTAASGHYRFEKDRMAESVGSMEHLPAFSGADRNFQRTAPVEFEKDQADPFGLDNLVSEAKKK